MRWGERWRNFLNPDAQEKMIDWFGSRNQVIGFVAACLLYIVVLAFIWYDPFQWHFYHTLGFHVFRAFHVSLEGFAIFSGIVFAPMMAYMTIESEFLNRLLIMKANRSEAVQARQDAALVAMLEGRLNTHSALRELQSAVQQLTTVVLAADAEQDVRAARVEAFLAQAMGTTPARRTSRGGPSAKGDADEDDSGA